MDCLVFIVPTVTAIAVLALCLMIPWHLRGPDRSDSTPFFNEELLDIHTVDSLLEFRFALPNDRSIARRLVTKFDSLPALAEGSQRAWRDRCKLAALWLSQGDLSDLQEVIEWGYSDPDSLITAASDDLRSRRKKFARWVMWP